MQIVTSHRSTDFDALASMIAATVLYPDTIPVLPNSVNPNVKAFLSIHKDIFDTYAPNEIALDAVDRLIVVDTSNWDRLDGMKPLKNKTDLDIILWDHHVEGDIKAGWVCREETGSCITLMVREMKARRKVISPVQATLFLMGLYEDTGNLSFLNTKAADAMAAAWLLERKADLNVLSSFIRQAYGEKQKGILFDVLKDAQRQKVSGFSISITCVEIAGHVGNLSVVVNMFREIMNVDAAFCIFVDISRGRSIVIGRGSSDALNIGTIMRGMGGGGHPGAGSAMLKGVKPEAIEEMIVDLIKGNQQSSVRISDLMSFPVFTVRSDTPMNEVALVLREKGCTGLPVVDDDKLVGVISRRDFRKARKKSQHTAPVRAFMSHDPVSIMPDQSPMEAARIMIKHDIGRLPVLDENGRIIGIVSRSDTMTYFYDLLPD
ncbi:MAG: tRNA nucleotidyl transferase [Deltaproteobacteria bacterium]|nr:MAG: tRNA nucleotidyl transferase [Deltaproteobacteria bacterium]